MDNLSPAGKSVVGRFLFGQGLSLFGSMLVQYAIMWRITLDTRSGVSMTLYVLLGILPTFFISPFGGVWADRFNRKLLINLADGSIALVSAAIAVALFLGYDGLWLLFAGAAARALGQGVHTPSINAFIPQITSPENLAKVNGINASIQSFAMIVSPLASGALLGLVPLATIFLIDVVTAIAGISILHFWVRTPEERSENKSSEKTSAGKPSEYAKLPDAGKSSANNYYRDFREGISYVSRHGFISRLILLSVVFYVAIAPVAFLTPLQVARNFGAEVWYLTAIEIAFSAGMMLGGLAIGFWGGFRNRIYSMALSCFLTGASTVVIGQPVSFAVYLAIMLFMGLTLPLYNTPSTVLFQTKVDPAYRGRVFGVFGMTSSLMMPAGMLIFGPLGDLVAIELLMTVSGIFLMLLSAFFVAGRTMREAGK
jgi:DHA3 family macrolide efflux protein-like MFS transporter